MSKLRVFLADDHPILRDGLKALINGQSDMHVSGEAGDGEAALLAMRRSVPDVAVLDISMPKVGGASLAAQLREELPEVRVVALTVHEDKSYLRQMLEAGVKGYVLKRAAADDLIHAIRTVAAGGVCLDPDLMATVVEGYIGRRPEDEPAPESTLSRREAEVLRLIAEGYTNREIAAQLEISVKTVETYKARVSEKLGLKTRAQIVRYALKRGWLEATP